jgi:hypothetical protein
MSDFLAIFNSVSPAVAGAAAALIGVWLTNVGNDNRAHLQAKTEREKERRNILRERGDELYQHAYRWAAQLRSDTLIWHGAMVGQYGVNEALDMEIAEFNDRKFDYGRIEMLVDVYFPEARAQLDSLLQHRDERSRYINAFKRSYKAGDLDGRTFAKQLMDSVAAFEGEFKGFARIIVESMRAL